jgi:hypothetical protein
MENLHNAIQGGYSRREVHSQVLEVCEAAHRAGDFAR